MLLTGGGDVDPARFGEAPHATTADVSAARDELEIGLTRWAVEQRGPLLAVCRGLQVLNVALGGSLHQDIPSEPGSPLDHSQLELQTSARSTPTHAVKVQDGSRLAGVLGALEVDVNSFHHQAIKRLGRGLTDVAWAPDAIIEGVELRRRSSVRPRGAVAPGGARRSRSSRAQSLRAPLRRSGRASGSRR